MRIATVLLPEVGQASGPDMTRYLIVCGATLGALVGLLWLFRKFVARQLQARAAKRSLQVLDVLPLAGKQKLVVVRCYDRSFLIGVGDKELCSIAELDAAVARSATPAFETALANQLEVVPPRVVSEPRSLGSKEGLLA